MANINQISLKVCGNPDANGGFQPMVIFNSPSIEIKDTFYTGFDANSYFFTIKIEKNQVVYKLIKNNVSSLGASRQGSLVIGIAIPKGYKLDIVSPYDVLMELKKAFITRCMTCKDPVTEKYEFNTNRVQPNILDDIAGSYVLVPVQMPYRPMAVEGPIAYINAAEDKISQLMKDVQYPTFAKYSEIVIAETVQSTSYYPITNISIPRMPEFSIYDDGVLQPTVVTDPKQPLTFNGKGDPNFYKNDSLMFTLEELLNGENVPNVSIDGANESINVSTKALQKPLIRKINVVFVPKEAETYFFTRRNDWALIYGNQSIPLKQDLSFDLTGEQLKILYAPQGFRIQQSHKDQYEAKVTSVSSNEIRITAEKVRRTSPVSGGKTSTGGVSQASNLNACEVQLLLNHAYHRSHCSIQFYNNNDDLLLSSTALFSRGTDGNYQAKVFVPKSWAGTDVHVCLKYKNELWCSISNIGRDVNGVIELHDKDFRCKKIGFFSKYSRGIIIGILMLLSLLLGGAIGTYIGITYLANVTKTFNCWKCGKIFATETEFSSHMCDEQPIQPQPIAGQENSVTCHDCGEGPFDELEFASHKNTCPKKVKCDKCSERFASDSDLNAHKASVHSTLNTQTYHCDICNREFTSSAGLRAHNNDLHSSKECKHCHENFDNQKALTDHMNKEHHFVCDECGPSTYFATQAELDSHKRSNKRPDGKHHSR